MKLLGASITREAVMLLVLLVYFVALSFSANLTYRHACNNSPVTYYSDPRLQNLVMEGHDLDTLQLEAGAIGHLVFQDVRLLEEGQLDLAS